MTFYDTFKADKPRFFQNAGLFIFAAALPFSVSLIQGGVLLYILTGLWRRHQAGTLGGLTAEIKANPLFIPWCLYFAAGILAALSGVATAHSFKGLNSDLLTAVSFFGLCLFLEPESRGTALKLYLVTVTAAAVYGIAQALGGLAHGLDVRAHATSHPVRFGEIIVIGLALALSQVSFQEELSPRLKKALYAAVLLLMAAVVLSQTRGAYLGMTLVLATLLLAKRPPKKIVLPLLASVFGLVLVFSVMNPTINRKLRSFVKGANSVVDSSKQAPDQAIGTRVVLWRTGFKMIKDYPVFGIGPGNVKKLFPLYCPQPYPEAQVWGSLHNIYLHQTAERGFVGLAALLTLFAFMLRAALRNFRAAPSPFTLWALTLMPSWFVMNMTEITFQHVHTSYAVFLALAVSAAAVKPEAK